MENLPDDPRFLKNALRVQNRTALNTILEPIFVSHTAQEWVELLRPKGIPVGRIQSVQEICEHPQTQSREMVIELEHPKAGAIRVTGIPIKLSATPGAVVTPPPGLGEHTQNVLRDWLGIA